MHPCCRLLGKTVHFSKLWHLQGEALLPGSSAGSLVSSGQGLPSPFLWIITHEEWPAGLLGALSMRTCEVFMGNLIVPRGGSFSSGLC